MQGKTDMSAKGGKALVQSDAGAYVAWSGVDQPELTAEGLGCGLLVLRPLSFALPHYADSHKFGYVLLGSGVAGVLPVATGNASSAARERVVRLEVGDVIAVRTGDVSWWYNDSDGDADDLSILFMGDTERAVSPGDISYFFLAGGNSVLGGFDMGLLARSWPGVTKEQAAAVFRSQPAVLLTGLSTKLPGVCPREHDRKGLVVNAGQVAAGTLETLTAADLAALGDLGISAVIGRLDPGAACAPWVLREGAAQAVYVARGSAGAGVFLRGRRDAAAGRGGRRGECVRRTAVRGGAHLRRRQRSRVGVPGQERQARGGAPDRGWLGARRLDRAGAAGVAERGAGAGGAARRPQRRAVALSGRCTRSRRGVRSLSVARVSRMLR
ncbi:unnamed protein product [Triticum turgidum subsp. durum]|uniref:Cupin type-1 domain-containing protein n=1 Tax=Triticum turgidum subsp. durum TaxID=4567 RepID=A0A9R0WR44_TRITD|nr:unnamed protein product [Triticum turgidum subsp. durum]